MLAWLLAASLASPVATPAGSPTPRPRPRVLRDAALAAGASAAVAFGKADIRRAILQDGRLRNVIDNFEDPIGRVREGTRRDSDPFWVNGIAHPVSFGLEALYLKRQGYGNGAAFAFTQVHSVLWELVVEGCAFPPSGKDLLTDAAGAAAAIWIVHPLMRHRRGGEGPLDVALVPARGGVRVRLAARF
jgi:hypothetical protein